MLFHTQEETYRKDYHLVHVGLKLMVSSVDNVSIGINTGVKNVFNTHYIDHLSRLKSLGIPNEGINFYIGLKMNPDKQLKKKAD